MAARRRIIDHADRRQSEPASELSAAEMSRRNEPGTMSAKRINSRRPPRRNMRPASNTAAGAGRLPIDDKPVALITLGMHRSGTSALTRVFNLLGADVPEHLIPPDSRNQTGYWESSDLGAIHDQLLASAGSNWYDWRAFNPGWFGSPVATRFRNEILAVLQRDFSASHLFVIKDPRISRFWPLWRNVVADFGAKPIIALPVRNPVEVAASLKARDSIVPAEGYLLWLRHVLDAEATTRNLPRAFVLYDALIEDWQTTIGRVSTQLRLNWPRRSASVDIEIENYLSTEFRHHAVEPERLAGKPDVGDWVREAYAALTEMAARPDNAFAKKRLDKIRNAFNEASAVFGVALAQNEIKISEKNAHIDRISAELSALRDESARRDTEQQNAAAVAATELETVRIALKEREQGFLEQQRLAKGLAEHVTEIGKRIDELSGERDQLAAALQAEKTATARSSDHITKAEAELRARDGELGRISRELEASRLYLRDSQAEVQRLAGEIDEARTDATRARAERHKFAESLAAASSECDRLGAALKRIRCESDSRGDQLNDLFQELRLATADAAQARRLESRLLAEITEKQRLTANNFEQAARIADLEARLAGAADKKSRISSGFAREVAHAASLAENKNGAQAGLRELEEQLTNAEATAAQSTASGKSWKPLWPWHQSKRRLARRLQHSGLFDAAWYANKYPDAVKSGRSPVEHYLEEGYKHGYRPNPLFDSRWYLQKYPDVRNARVNPLVHYLQSGYREGRNPGPDFETDFYLLTYPDVRKNGINPLAHYLRYGQNEGRLPKRP